MTPPSFAASDPWVRPETEYVPPLRWGILGTGRIAAVFARDLRHLPGARLVAVGSRTVDSARRFASAHAIERHYGSYRDLVSATDVQAVYVATPHPWHASTATLAINADKAVLIEKPFTLTALQARVLRDVARRRRVFLMEAMWTRFLPHMRWLRMLQRDGTLGQVCSVTADFGALTPEIAGDRMWNHALGGGALLDQGIYAVSFASMLLGPPSDIQAKSILSTTGVDAQTSMLFGYRNGAHALLTTSMLADSACTATVVGTRARVEIDRPWFRNSSATMVPRNGEPVRFEASLMPPGVKGLHLQAAEVARCVAAGSAESDVMPLNESVAVIETLDAVRGQTGLIYPVRE